MGPVYPGPRWAVPAAKTKGLVQNVVGESPLSCPKWGVLKAGTEQDLGSGALQGIAQEVQEPEEEAVLLSQGLGPGS